MTLVLCNSGPLIALGKLNRLEVLADLFVEVRIPRAVYNEVVTEGLVRGEPDALTVRLFWLSRGWPVVDLTEAQLTAYVPPVILDPGETETLALALSLGNPLVLLDDEVARTEARRLGLKMVGTLGILARAFRQRLLTLGQVELLIREIAERPDIWISPTLCEQVLASLHQDQRV